MHLGFGLYRHQLDEDHFQFAKQAGASHLVVHLVDYFAGRNGESRNDQPIGDDHGWGHAGDPEKLWTAAELIQLRKRIENAGLTLYAVENLDPAHWHDILLDGPLRSKHIANVKQIIRAMGEAGIPALGYNFSLAGVSGRVNGKFARGGAMSVGMQGAVNSPLPRRMVWNMIVDEAAGNEPHAPVTSAQLWDRIRRFLDEIIPVAEQSGVRLAAHPDDPPMPTVRGTPRLVYQPRLYQKLIDLADSRSNGLELCVGTLAEATDLDLYECLERYAQQGRIVYVHLRNICGKVPCYHETFIDDGDVDIPRVLRILHRHRFDGVIIPDHAPQMTCAAPWHAGMAFAMGFLKCAIQTVQSQPPHSEGSE